MSKTSPTVKFVANNPQKEAEYVCFLAKNISRGYYQDGGFFVLPYAEKLNNKAVYFPDIKLSKDFWKQITDCKNRHLGGIFPKECVEEVILKLPKSPNPTTSKIIASWRKTEKAFFEAIGSLFIGQAGKVKTIDFLLTGYGTLGSYYIQNGHFVATHRLDIPADDIGRKILYMFVKFTTRKSTEIGEADWHQRRSIAEFLLTSTKLRQILPNARSSAPNKRESQLKKDSDAYLARLGFSFKDRIFKASQWGKIAINGQDINKLFTPQEEQVIKTLLQNKGEIVTFSDFVNVPSLYALSKVMENIRKKCRNLGINKEVISTIRGKGYLIN